MVRSIVRVVVVAGLLSATWGCSPGLGTSLTVGPIPVPGGVGGIAGAPVWVENVVDGRPAQTVGTIGGRAIRAEGDVPGRVHVALVDLLKQHGFRLAAGDAPVLRGTVLEWNIAVTPGFPSSVAEGSALLELEVVGSAGGAPSIRRYAGSATLRHPFMREEDVQATLGEAMAYALTAAMEDGELIERLRVGAPPRG